MNWRRFSRIPGFREGYETMLSLKERDKALEVGAREREVLKKNCEVQASDLERQGCLLLKEKEEEEARLRNALEGKSVYRAKIDYWKGNLYLAFAFLLCLGYFALYLWTFDALELGWKKYVFAGILVFLGCVLFEFFAVRLEKILPEDRAAKVFLFVGITGIVFIAASVLFFGEIRALYQKLIYALEGGSSGGDIQASQGDPVNEFYERISGILLLTWPLLGIAFEIATGLLLYHGLKLHIRGRQVIELLRGIKKKNRRLLAIAKEVENLKNYPGSFWHGFQNGVVFAERKLQDSQSERPRKFLRSLLIYVVVLFILIFLASLAFGEPKRSLVVGLDMTKSSLSKDYAGNEIFRKNLSAVGEVMRRIRPGTKVHVVGITDSTFLNPLFILRETLPEKPKTFRERFRGKSLASVWRGMESRLKPLIAKSTDVLGVFFLAEQIFATEGAGKKTLIIISDMLHTSPPGLKKILSRGSDLVGKLRKPNLQGVDVWVYGAGSPCLSKGEWFKLRDFWEAYIRETGANLKCYTNLREIRGF